MFSIRISSHVFQRIKKLLLSNPKKTLESKLEAYPQNRGEFDPYKVFPVQFPWQKYLELKDHELKSWEKLDKYLVMRYRKSFRYQQYGLVMDDFFNGELPHVAEALHRLPKEIYAAREKRLQRATNLSLQRKILPKEEWTKPEDDVPYLYPYILWVETEMTEVDADQIARNNIVIPPISKYKHDDFGGGLGPIFDKRHLE